MDTHIEEAAQDLGANEWTTFRKVTLPLIAPGVVAAALLAFALSIDDFRSDGHAHRGGGPGPRGERVDDVPQGHAAAHRTGGRRGRAARVRAVDRRLPI